ncbi:MAG: hypothetical protein ABEJ34_04825 [Haloferacaceae archaeon]
MILPLDGRTRWHDVALVGSILAGVSFYATRVSGGNVMPNLIRFYDVSPDRTYAATMPQEKALLLLVDPATEASKQVTGAGPSVDPLWNLLLVVGLVAMFGGAFLAYVDD